MLLKVASAAALFGLALGFPPHGSTPHGPHNGNHGRPGHHGNHGNHDNSPENLAKRLGTYSPPGPTDSRGPCPALNTIANHGLISHDGKNLKSNDIINAFHQAFTLEADALATAITNFGVVCEYVTGVSCADPSGDGTFTFANLTLLGHPHAFEHDHSFSRLDYFEGFGNGSPQDNIFFNSTEFQNSLDTIGFTPSNPPKVALADYSDFNQIRLNRESVKNTDDSPGGFQQNVPVQLFEVGFIFGAMFDRDHKGRPLNSPPQVRVDWWNFWFSEESFPTQLGWVPASTGIFDNSFVTSVSAQVLEAAPTSLPPNLPPHATDQTASLPGPLPSADPMPTFTLFDGTAYVAPTAPSLIHEATSRPTSPSWTSHYPRQAEATQLAAREENLLRGIAKAPEDVLHKASITVGPAPTPYNWYQDKLNMDQVRAQVSAVQSYESALVKAVQSMS